MARDAFHHVTSFDRGFGRTIVDLLRRPADVAQGYWRGRTAPYAGPGRFFLVAISVVQIAVFALGLAPDFMDSFAEGFNEGRRSGAEIIDSATLVERLQRFWVIGLVGFVPTMTFWSGVVFRRARRTVAEHTVAHLYFLGMFVLLLGVSVVSGGALHDHVSGTVGYAFEAVTFVGAWAVYVWSTGRTFGATRWKGLAGATVAVLLGFVSYFTLVSLATAALLHNG